MLESESAVHNFQWKAIGSIDTRASTFFLLQYWANEKGPNTILQPKLTISLQSKTTTPQYL